MGIRCFLRPGDGRHETVLLKHVDMIYPRFRLDVWNLIPGEGSAEQVKAMVRNKIQVSVSPRPW